MGLVFCDECGLVFAPGENFWTVQAGDSLTMLHLHADCKANMAHVGIPDGTGKINFLPVLSRNVTSEVRAKRIVQ